MKKAAFLLLFAVTNILSFAATNKIVTWIYSNRKAIHDEGEASTLQKTKRQLRALEDPSRLLQECSESGACDCAPAGPSCTTNADCCPGGEDECLEFCDIPIGECSPMAGICTEKPGGTNVVVCATIFLPVCSCLGETIGSPCDAKYNGIAVERRGEC